MDTVTTQLTIFPSAVRKGMCAASLAMQFACGHGAFAAPSADPVQASEAVALIETGQFKAAGASIEHALDKRLPPAARHALEFERERMHRIRLDFTLTLAEVEARLRKQIPDLTAAELRAWDAAGLLEKKTIDAETRYFKRAPANLFRLSAQAAARRTENTPFIGGPMETANAHHRQIREEAIAAGATSAAPRHVRIKYSMTVKPDSVPHGEIVRAWLPFPREIPGQQERVRLIRSSPRGGAPAPESALQRTVYLEQRARRGEPAVFLIEYELTIFGRYYAIDPEKVIPANPTPALLAHLGERKPHIVFTQDMRKFSRAVVGAEKNPYRIAQKLFAAVDRIPWAGALEYSTIANISDYALKAGHADCGQQTLLLMTLLRLNGIPARWQSGWVFSDGDYNTMHDWGWLHLAPYGWVPMDVTFGRLRADDPALDEFYLGGLDAYRIAFNDDFSQPFSPRKRHFRSETVDSQRGEVEWTGGNLYFDRWDYEFSATVSSATRSK